MAATVFWTSGYWPYVESINLNHEQAVDIAGIVQGWARDKTAPSKPEYRLTDNREVSLDSLISNSEDESTLGNILPSIDHDAQERHRQALIADAKIVAGPRNGSIWQDYNNGYTQVELANKYGISQPRIKRILNNVSCRLAQNPDKPHTAIESTFYAESQGRAVRQHHVTAWWGNLESRQIREARELLENAGWDIQYINCGYRLTTPDGKPYKDSSDDARAVSKSTIVSLGACPSNTKVTYAKPIRTV